MPPRLFPYAFLLSLCVATALANRRDSSYYQDLLRDRSSEDIRLNEIAKLLEKSAKNAEAYAAASLSRRKEHERREIERANKFKGAEEILKDDILGVYTKRRPTIPYSHPAPQLGDITDAENLRRQFATNINFYPLMNPMNHIVRGYPGYNGPYEVRLNPEPPTSGYRSHHQEVIERGMKEEPSPDFGGRYPSLGRQYLDRQYSGGGAIDDAEESHPDFTYEIAPATQDRQELKFAVAPPNEKFYHDGPLNDVTEKVVEHAVQIDDRDTTDQQPTSKFTTVAKTRQESVNSVLPEPKRRAENHNPVVMAVAEHKFSNDIYFVAVVAGCSAAAMFILVLISLTWCRLQRGAKAAADVEYPAYGVTGPNKDTSPSGDRRLAQSAQMYHYQHQKQQIIAMESRTASGRDPGSVSEAESDEENEEGDYTVYECPGLAPTGEMEVKNPLFHDDPTPATPAGQSQNKRSLEDHM